MLIVGWRKLVLGLDTAIATIQLELSKYSNKKESPNTNNTSHTKNLNKGISSLLFALNWIGLRRVREPREYCIGVSCPLYLLYFLLTILARSFSRLHRRTYKIHTHTNYPLIDQLLHVCADDWLLSYLQYPQHVNKGSSRPCTTKHEKHLVFME